MRHRKTTEVRGNSMSKGGGGQPDVFLVHVLWAQYWEECIGDTQREHVYHGMGEETARGTPANSKRSKINSTV